MTNAVQQKLCNHLFHYLAQDQAASVSTNAQKQSNVDSSLATSDSLLVVAFSKVSLPFDN